MATLCGKEIPNWKFNATDNKMLVVMQTDSSVEAKGFSAKFKTVKSSESTFFIPTDLIVLLGMRWNYTGQRKWFNRNGLV